MNDTNAEFVFLSNTGNYRYLSLHAGVADTKWQMTHVQMISGLLKSKCDPSHFVPSQTYVVCHPHKYEFLLSISIMSCSETKFVCRDKTLVPQSLVALHKNDLNESQNKAEHNRKNTFIVADSNFTSFHIFLSQSTTTTTLSKSLFMHTHTHTHTPIISTMSLPEIREKKNMKVDKNEREEKPKSTITSISSNQVPKRKLVDYTKQRRNDMVSTSTMLVAEKFTKVTTAQQQVPKRKLVDYTKQRCNDMVSTSTMVVAEKFTKVPTYQQPSKLWKGGGHCDADDNIVHFLFPIRRLDRTRCMSRAELVETFHRRRSSVVSNNSSIGTAGREEADSQEHPGGKANGTVMMMRRRSSSCGAGGREFIRGTMGKRVSIISCILRDCDKYDDSLEWSTTSWNAAADE